MTDHDDVPVELRRLWGLASESNRGRPATLDLDTVLRAALDLADREGLAGATLPKIAKALGFTPMSLYRHVGSKSELLTLMQEYATEDPPELDTAPAEWREGLRRWAVALCGMYDRRPWLARVPTAGPPSGPKQLGWMEAGLHALRGTGLGWSEKVGILMLLSGYVRDSSVLSQDMASGRGDLGQAEAEQQYGRALAGLVTSERFPQLAEMLGSGLFEATPDDDGDPAEHPDFVFGLERLLDGAAAAVPH